LLLAGCGDDKPSSKKAVPPSVVVSQAKLASIPVERQFVGSTEAVKLVDIRAKVEGYLEQRPFTEGADVETGDVLFVIDQRPFKAALEEANAELEQNEAALEFARQEVDRYKNLSQQSAASVQSYQSAKARELEASAAVKSSQAAIRNAQLDIDYSTISAPIDGRIGQTLVNVGNLVSEEDTLLTTLVQLDPLYVYFSPSEADYQEILSYQAKGPLEFSLLLAGNQLYPHQGMLDFVDNQVDITTGTIKMRAVFPNPDKTQRPGQYVQVKIKLGETQHSILVPAQAIGEDESGHFVFVIDKNNKSERRKVSLGQPYKGQYVVDQGLKEGESVVIKGLQKLHGGEIVTVEQDTSKATTKTDNKLS